MAFFSFEGIAPRWMLASHVAAKLLSNMEDNLCIERGSCKLKDLQKSAVKVDKNLINECCDFLKQ